MDNKERSNKPTIKDKQKTLFSRQRQLRIKPTKYELIFKNFLIEIGVDFIFQKAFIAKDYYCIVDFYIPKPYKIVIEIDGEYHNNNSQILKDKKRDDYLTRVRGFSVIRIKNQDVNSLETKMLIHKLFNINT